MLDNLVSLLGGRVAEKLVLDDISTGASNDIERASKIARDMVTKYGMSDTIGPISFRSENDEVFLGMSYSSGREYSEKLAAEIDTEVKSIIDNAYERCTKILTENMTKLHNVAQALFEKEKINGEEFVEIFNQDENVVETVEETEE